VARRERAKNARCKFFRFRCLCAGRRKFLRPGHENRYAVRHPRERRVSRQGRAGRLGDSWGGGALCMCRANTCKRVGEEDRRAAWRANAAQHGSEYMAERIGSRSVHNGSTGRRDSNGESKQAKLKRRSDVKRRRCRVGHAGCRRSPSVERVPRPDRRRLASRYIAREEGPPSLEAVSEGKRMRGGSAGGRNDAAAISRAGIRAPSPPGGSGKATHVVRFADGGCVALLQLMLTC
jgi:hypothetical protein